MATTGDPEHITWSYKNVMIRKMTWNKRGSEKMTTSIHGHLGWSETRARPACWWSLGSSRPPPTWCVPPA
jgi:hypothetical protein